MEIFCVSTFYRSHVFTFSFFIGETSFSLVAFLVGTFESSLKSNTLETRLDLRNSEFLLWLELNLLAEGDLTYWPGLLLIVGDFTYWPALDPWFPLCKAIVYHSEM
jgi:hypothetical protein